MSVLVRKFRKIAIIYLPSSSRGMFDFCSPWSFLLLEAAAAAGTMTGAEPESCRSVRDAHLFQDTQDFLL